MEKLADDSDFSDTWTGSKQSTNWFYWRTGPALFEGKEMRCRKVTLLADLEGDKIIEFDKHLPYGFLHLDGPDLEPNTFAAIINKIDFKNA